MQYLILAEGAGIEPAYAKCIDVDWFSGPAPYRSANPPMLRLQRLAETPRFERGFPFGIGRLALCWFNQFTHVSVRTTVLQFIQKGGQDAHPTAGKTPALRLHVSVEFWCHWRELNPQTLVSKTSGYANSPTVALVPLSGFEPPNTAF
jgi:hypothetical protein